MVKTFSFQFKFNSITVAFPGNRGRWGGGEN